VPLPLSSAQDTPAKMDLYHAPDAQRVELLKEIANKIRVISVDSTNACKSG